MSLFAFILYICFKFVSKEKGKGRQEKYMKGWKIAKDIDFKDSSEPEDFLMGCITDSSPKLPSQASLTTL